MAQQTERPVTKSTSYLYNETNWAFWKTFQEFSILLKLALITLCVPLCAPKRSKKENVISKDTRSSLTSEKKRKARETLIRSAKVQNSTPHPWKKGKDPYQVEGIWCGAKTYLVMHISQSQSYHLFFISADSILWIFLPALTGHSMTI